MTEEHKGETKFEYSYSAPTEEERREIESIRKQYVSAPEEEGIIRLRRLNKRVTRPPFVVSFIVGIIGTLILGVGMTMTLEWKIYVWGSVVGIFGIAVAAVAYPIRKAMLKRNKRKYGQEIIALSNELLNANE